MNDIDIFQRTLKCQRISSDESEIEKSSMECDEEQIEETYPIEEVSERIDPLRLCHDLACLKRSVQKLRLMLKRKEDPSTEKLPCCQLLEVCVLQKQQHELQLQINESIRALQATRREIHDLYSHYCKMAKDMKVLKKLLAFLEYWQHGLKVDEHVCYERYVYIKDHKADLSRIEQLFEKEQLDREKLYSNYLHERVYEQNKIYLQAEIERLSALFVEQFESKPKVREEISCETIDATGEVKLKKIEIDFIEGEIEKAKKLENPRCARHFKCNAVDF